MLSRNSFNLRTLFGRRCIQYFAAISASLGILSSEMHFGWSSPALPVLTNGTYYFNVSSEEASWLAIAFFPGMVVGAVLSNFMADFGRKMLILGTSVPLFVSWLCMALARTDFLMFWGRFLGGLGGGLSFATVPMYLGEVSEPAIRGFLSSLCPVFVVVGILLINILGIYLPMDTTAFISCSIPLIGFISFIWMPESPVQLLYQGKSEEAKRNLRILRGEQEGDKEFVRLSNDLEDSMQDQKEGNPTFMDLFNNAVNRKAMLISIGLRSVQQLCGATAITFYCKTIFEQNEEFVSGDIATIIYFSLQAVLSILASFVVDYFGRRPMFIFSLAGTTLTLFWASTYLAVQTHTSLDLNGYSSILTLALLVNVAFISVGVRNVPLLVMSEIFHPKIKPLALCVVTIYYGILAIAVTKFYHITNEQVEMSFPMFTFGVLSLICLVVYYFYVPETKGKTLEEIQKMLKG